MSTTTEISPDELREQIAGYQQQVDEAEREIGAATLEGRSATAAVKRAGAARDAIRHRETALEELERRDAERAEQEAEAAAAATRRQFYIWAAGYLRAAAEAVRAFNALQAAEEALVPLAHTKAGGGPLYMLRTLQSRLDPRVGDRLDWRIVKSIPGGAKSSWIAKEARHLIGTTKADRDRLSPAWFEEQAALADELAEAEEAA